MVVRSLNPYTAIIMNHIKYTLITVVALFLSAATCAAQKTVDEDLSHLGNFDRIDASVGWDITFTQSATTSIKVSYSEEVADRVRMKVKNGRLILGLENQKNNNKPRKVILKATVSAPSLSAIKVTTGAEVKFGTPLKLEGDLSINATTGAEVEGLALTAKGFNCHVTTGASVEGMIDVANASLVCTTGSDIDLTGRASTATLKCSTGADISARGLVVQNGRCSASTAGDISITIKKKAKVGASTGADINLYGKPQEIEGKIRGVNIR